MAYDSFGIFVFLFPPLTHHLYDANIRNSSLQVMATEALILSFDVCVVGE